MDREMTRRTKIFKRMISTVQEMTNQPMEEVKDMIGLETEEA